MFISSGRTMTSKRSSRRKMRACILASIFPVRPFSQSSARPLLLKLLITPQCQLITYGCQHLVYKPQACCCNLELKLARYFSATLAGREPIGVRLHASVETALREFIDENGGGPGVRLRKRQHKKG